MDNMLTREETYRLLTEGRFNDLIKAFDTAPNKVRNFVTMATYSREGPLCRQAVEFIGYLAKERAVCRPEYFREIIRRHIWGMNDEGANVDWAAPEIIGSIIANQPELYGEFASIMIEASIDEAIFQAGMLRAVRQIGCKNKKLIEDFLPRLRLFINHENKELAELAKEVLREIEG